MRITYLFLILLTPLVMWGENINHVPNGDFETDYANNWTLNTVGDAAASCSGYDDIASWDNSVKKRFQIIVTETNTTPNVRDVYIENSNEIQLAPGDSCYLTYYGRSDPASASMETMLVSTDNETGEETIISFESRVLDGAFNGMKKISAIVAKAGKYKFRLACGGTSCSYVYDNIILNTFDYQSDGAPIISSFQVQMEQQGDQGVNQIIGRTEVQDIEGDNFTMDYSIVSGGGTLTKLDENSFVYEITTPGEKIFKVIATDENGNHSSKTATYTSSDYDTSQLYFNEGIWEVVRAQNGYTNHASFGFPTNDPTLPNVLLLGNSISIGYTPYVRTNLEGEVNLYRIPDNGGSTLDMLDKYKLWLGGTHWDVIHFNWGLHDLKYLLNNSLNLNGTQVVPVEEYAVNLEKIISILSESADHLIFATTSHIPSSAAGRKSGDEVIYNEAALIVMARHPEIMIDDQYTLTNEYPEHNNESDVHFTGTGKQRQATQVEESIIKALDTTTNTVKIKMKTIIQYNSKSAIISINDDIVITRCNIYNTYGQLVKQYGQNTNMYNITNLPQGIYIISAKADDNTNFTQTIIKQ